MIVIGLGQLMRPSLSALLLLVLAAPAAAQTAIRIMPPDGATLAIGQRFDIRVEATAPEGGPPPAGLRVTLDGVDVTARNVLAPGANGARGFGGTGTPAGAARPAAAAPAHTTNLLIHDHVLAREGAHLLVAETADGTRAEVRLHGVAWQTPRPGARVAKNIIFLLGDGMGIAHRTAARLVARGLVHGKPTAPLAMDTLPITGLVMTSSLDAAITDSAPGMAAYVTGNKSNNHQEGVYPDNTDDAFDNPRAEYLSALLARTRGPGFRTGLVTTSDVTDATPAANAVHTALRAASQAIAARYLDERDRHALSVLLGGGANHFLTVDEGGQRRDGRDLTREFAAEGFDVIHTGADVRARLSGPPPAALLGLFHPSHMPVAFDKVGAGGYSDELGREANAPYRDLPMLDDMTRLALASLRAHAPDGFYLMVEGASIDKRAHDADPERTIWDIIEFDRAIQVAIDFAARTNNDDDPSNDTLVVVTADHETGGMAVIAVGNERYAPRVVGAATRDYVAPYRLSPETALNQNPNYDVDAAGYPRDPDPTRKVVVGWASVPDRYENFISNRVMLPAAIGATTDGTRVSVANPARSGPGETSDNRTADGQAIPGVMMPGTIEHGAFGCRAADGCPDGSAAHPHTITNHTASDVPLSAGGAGAWQFTGTYDNTAVFFKLLRAAMGSYPEP